MLAKCPCTGASTAVSARRGGRALPSWSSSCASLGWRSSGAPARAVSLPASGTRCSREPWPA
eukprot:3393297-Alexandrium_andersonii.AAC.1